jgi:hypothetical protein
MACVLKIIGKKIIDLAYEEKEREAMMVSFSV